MGKMFNALLLVVAIEIAFALFPAPDSSTTSLLDFLENPSLWDANTWLFNILTSVTALGATAIIIGSFITGRDWIWRASLVAMFLTFGAVIMQLWIFINAHFVFIGVEAARRLFTTILVAPLMLYFVVTVLDFVSAKD